MVATNCNKTSLPHDLESLRISPKNVRKTWLRLQTCLLFPIHESQRTVLYPCYTSYPSNMKTIYLIQPYLVGSKSGRSLALIIPAKVAQTYNINPSTIFELRTDVNSRSITLRQTWYSEKREVQNECEPAESLSTERLSRQLEPSRGDVH